ncbi:MAG: phosphatidylserine decarboxylase [Clostridiaceae bacterium]|nr:phosphatidylserine decarboxylase [Clostridiaceae bacterium]
MIKFYNRRTKKYETEKVLGEKYLEWSYSSPIGMSLLNLLIKKKIFSKVYGYFCDTSRSRKKIHNFISDFDIDISISKKTAFEFESFNDFFTRELTAKARPITSNCKILTSPGDGRVLVYEDIDLDKLVQVKGYTYSLNELLKDYSTAANYNGGVCMIVRLCPTDYHRFHFIDNGSCSKTNKIKGDFYSVSPIALKKIPQLYCKNKREWSVFHSENFGDILQVEVGATCVGTIVQNYEVDSPVKKGQEKGYFKFGGSTVILFFEPNKIKIDRDIIKQSKLGIETKILMGEKIGKAN